MVHTNCDGGGGLYYRLGGGYSYTYRCVYIGVWAPIHEYFFSDSRAVKDGAACGTALVVVRGGGGTSVYVGGGGGRGEGGGGGGGGTGTVPRRRHRGRPPKPSPPFRRGWPGPPPTPKCTAQHGNHEAWPLDVMARVQVFP